MTEVALKEHPMQARSQTTDRKAEKRTLAADREEAESSPELSHTPGDGHLQRSGMETTRSTGWGLSPGPLKDQGWG